MKRMQAPRGLWKAAALLLSVVIIVAVSFNIDRLGGLASRTVKLPPAVCGGKGSKEALKQRNRLSKMLNHVRQEMMQQDCEHREKLVHATKVQRSASESGGWCRNASDLHSAAHATDKKLASAFSHFLKGKTVAGFGDGPGHYKKIHDELNLMARYDAYDGSPYIETITDGRVTYMDLTVPQYGRPLYDWIICLEVAEHIPHKYQDIFVDNLARHAKTGIILSWAAIGQPGLSHVNNQDPEQVAEIMKNVGFSVDEVQSQVLRNVSAVPWLRRNVRVYFRDSDSFADPDEA